MSQAIKKYISKEYQVKIAIGAPTGTFAKGDVIANNAVLANATFYAVVLAVKGTGADTYLICNSFGGTRVNGVEYGSTAIVADAETIYGYVASSGASTGASAVVDTVTGADGADVALTSRGIERVKKIGNRVVSEVLVALKHFKHRYLAEQDFDVAATISSSVVSGSAGAIVDISNGDTILLTVTASEPIQVPAGTTVAFTTGTGANAREFTYLSGNNTTALVFSYTPVAADIGIAGTVGGVATATSNDMREVSIQDNVVYTKLLTKVLPAATGAETISIQA